MKPEFALSLSFDGIRLLHRAAGGWREVGAVDIATDDLTDSLKSLRQKAGQVKNKRVRTKLIIPDDQIKYLTIETGDVDTKARRTAARAALDGATPYPVNALAFDISVDGDKTHIAAVARETLAEAEAFAVEHRFHPVSFVAAPQGDGFLGEPFFGQTAHADHILAKGAKVEPDGIRVVIVSHAPDPEQQEQPEPAKTSIPKGEEAAKTAAAPPEKAKPGADAPHAKAEPKPNAQHDGVKVPKVDDTAAPALGDVPETKTTDSADAAKDAARTTRQNAKDAAPTSDRPTALIAADGQAVNGKDSRAKDAPLKVSDPDESSPLMGFASRRHAPSDGAPATPLGGVTRDPPASPPVARLHVSDAAADTSPAPILNPQQAAKKSLRAAPPIEDLPPAREPSPQKTPAEKGGFLSRRKPKRIPPAPPTRQTAPTAAPAASAAVATDAEAQRMTVFGARTDVQVGGKPRFLGLILTVILLVFLAGVAAWASVFLDDGLAKLFPKRERTLASTLPADAGQSLAEDVGATVELEPTGPGGDELIVATLNEGLNGDGLTAEDAAVLDALRDPQPNPTVQEELDSAALEARYAVTGIWPKAPDIPPSPSDLIALEDLYVTGIDPISPALDAIALPGTQSYLTDVALPDIASPPAPGTRFALDENGRVVPTEDGALSPDGFTVFLGAPPLKPPTAQRQEDAPETGGTPAAPQALALAQARPRARPDDLVEQNERATLGGLSRSELALLRPRLRPAAPQEAKAVQDVDTTNLTENEVTEPISPLAVAQSRRPETRPRNFNRTVARATRTAAAPQQVAAVAPRTVTPAIPSSASVTREATVRNAINLSRVNLIGVYGTLSNRRALVRLKSGRYQKVKVGDRFDGGRVSAIGDSELRYQKGNRNLVLKMPN